MPPKKPRVQEIDYRGAIRKVQIRIHPSLSIRPKTIVLINKIMNNTNALLIRECHKHFKPTKNKLEMTADLAERAVQRICSDELQRHAIAAGQTNVMKFHANLLTYTVKFDKLRIREPTERQKKETWGQSFNRGLDHLLQMTQSEASIDQRAKKSIGNFLNHLILKLSRELRDIENRMLTQADVQKAVEDIFPEVMANHAKSEGQKMIFIADTLGISYRIPRNIYHKRNRNSLKKKTESVKEETETGNKFYRTVAQ